MKAFKTSAIYVCAILGAGFATGKELLEYFGIYGMWGLTGVIISSILFGAVAYKVLKYNCFKENKLIKIISSIFLIVLYSAMLSASGELFKAIFNMPFIYGLGIMSIICLISISDKGETLGNTSMILFPIIIIISIITGIYILKTGKLMPNKQGFTPKIIVNAILYSSYNIITAVNILIYERDSKTAAKTAIISGVSIFILAAILVLPIIYNYNTIKYEALPILYLIPKNSIVFYMYIIMLVSAIYTTAITNGISAVRQTGLSPISTTLTAVMLAFLSFNTIVSKVYFAFGIIGLIILFKILLEKTEREPFNE